MSVFIEGLGLSNYRSFGSQMQRMGPFGKINLFAGQNNSGKSNILRFLTLHYRDSLMTQVGGRVGNFDRDLDRSIGSENDTMRISFGLDTNKGNSARLHENLQAKLLQQHLLRLDPIGKILRSKTLSYDGSVVWFDSLCIYPGAPLTEDETLADRMLSENIFNDNRMWSEVYQALTGQRYQSFNNTVARECVIGTLKCLHPRRFPVPEIELIPAIRSLGEPGTKPKDYSGQGIIERLVVLQSPEFSRQTDKLLFAKINEFLCEVLGKAEASLEVPHDHNTILAHVDGRTLPLQSLGTGVHEAVILAVVATSLKDQIVCIEEPELHLHPIMQKKLIRYLSRNTSNQYFITTHSAALLDTPEAAVFHVTYQEGFSRVCRIETPDKHSDLRDDLGFRASDLIQSNFIVWVEGPTDRMYINHWIKAEAPELVEGLHYSILFYGGRLLCHLSANDQEVEDFIKLRSINRHLAIIMDSDKTASTEEINRTKQRVANEFSLKGGIAWITDGREIENYVSAEHIFDCIKTIDAHAQELESTDKYSHRFRYTTTLDRGVKEIDKIKLARLVVARDANLDVLDLGERIAGLVEEIRRSNYPVT